MKLLTTTPEIVIARIKPKPINDFFFLINKLMKVLSFIEKLKLSSVLIISQTALN